MCSNPFKGWLIYGSWFLFLAANVMIDEAKEADSALVVFTSCFPRGKTARRKWCDTAGAGY